MRWFKGIWVQTCLIVHGHKFFLVVIHTSRSLKSSFRLRANCYSSLLICKIRCSSNSRCDSPMHNKLDSQTSNFCQPNNLDNNLTRTCWASKASNQPATNPSQAYHPPRDKIKCMTNSNPTTKAKQIIFCQPLKCIKPH